MIVRWLRTRLFTPWIGMVHRMVAACIVTMAMMVLRGGIRVQGAKGCTLTWDRSAYCKGQGEQANQASVNGAYHPG